MRVNQKKLVVVLRLVQLSNEQGKILSDVEKAILKQLSKRFKPSIGKRIKYALIVSTKGLPALASLIGKEVYEAFSDPIDRYLIVSAICKSFNINLISRAFGISPESVPVFIEQMDEIMINYLIRVATEMGLIKKDSETSKDTM